MLQRLGAGFARFAQRYVPDPFVLAVLLTLVSFAAALVTVGGDVEAVLDAWAGTGGGKGFWGLLTFGMQMCLILVTGHALAESPPAARLIHALADRTRGPAGAIAIVAVASMLLGLVNWGLGLIAGALLARKVGQRARERGIEVHYPLVVAAGYTGLLVWHGGLSGSAPLKVTGATDLAEVLGAQTAAAVGAIPLSSPLGSVSTLITNALLLLLVPLVLVRMLPKDASERIGPPDLSADEAEAVTDPGVTTPAERIERSPWLMLAIVLPGLAAFGMIVADKGLARLDLNTINLGFLFLGLLLHGSTRSYVEAVSDGARGCAGIILQFPFYAGIMGVLAGSGLLAEMATALASLGGTVLPAAGFYMAGLVNLFVPSGGGQWAVQGPLFIEAALEAGVDPARMVMALAYGDQWTNMLQPFWALPLLAITKVRARDIIGYTAVLLVLAQVPFLLGLYLPF